MKELCYLVALIVVVTVSVAGPGAAASLPASNLLTFHFEDTPVRSAIDLLFAGTGIRYIITPDVEGKFNQVVLNGVTIDMALRIMSQVAEISYTNIDGVYIITGASSKYGAVSDPVLVRDATKEEISQWNRRNRVKTTVVLP